MLQHRWFRYRTAPQKSKPNLFVASAAPPHAADDGCPSSSLAVHDYATALGKDIKTNVPGTGLQKVRTMMPMFAAGNALDVEPLADNDRELFLNVRGCRYADYFRSIGEPEFGAMITCDMDPPMMDAIGTDVRMDRTQTIGKGASHCDFRWRAEG